MIRWAKGPLQGHVEPPLPKNGWWRYKWGADGCRVNCFHRTAHCECYKSRTQIDCATLRRLLKWGCFSWPVLGRGLTSIPGPQTFLDRPNVWFRSADRLLIGVLCLLVAALDLCFINLYHFYWV